MITQIRKLACCGLAAAAALAAADASYVGKWKMNVAKSDFGDTTITFAQAPSGGMQMTVDGQSYAFKTDGADYDGMFGSKMSWRATDAGAWEATNKMTARASAWCPRGRRRRVRLLRLRSFTSGCPVRPASPENGRPGT
jgi:hypothetical protein